MNPILNSKILNESSTNEPFIILHGLFGMLDNWQTLGNQYALERPVHLVELRNHGRSFWSNSMTFEEMSKDLYDYLQFHGISSCTALGHSLGGKVVMNAAFLYPDKFSKIIIADIAPKTYPPHHQDYLMAMKSIDFTQVENRKSVEHILHQYIRSTSIIQFILKNIYRNEEGNYGFRFNLKALDENYSQMIESPTLLGLYNKPSLFIYGKKSDYVLLEDHWLIEQLFPKAIFAGVNNAGHWLHAENPTDFFNLTEAFINA